jgi:hypothetical protein
VVVETIDLDDDVDEDGLEVDEDTDVDGDEENGINEDGAGLERLDSPEHRDTEAAA